MAAQRSKMELVEEKRRHSLAHEREEAQRALQEQAKALCTEATVHLQLLYSLMSGQFHSMHPKPNLHGGLVWRWLADFGLIAFIWDCPTAVICSAVAYSPVRLHLIVSNVPISV
eukprot:scaffold135137_cov16-Prasinocladus_malaysianus.AAC.1